MSLRQTRRIASIIWVPWFAFSVQTTLAAILLLAPDEASVNALYLWLVPGLVPVIMLLNMPLIAALFSLPSVRVGQRRNHALEHATIARLEADYGSAQFLGGRATAGGFRVSGARTRHDIVSAFGELRASVERGEPLPSVSPRCGSNYICSLALASLLPAVMAGLGILVRSEVASFVLVAAAVAAFATLRRRIANAVQQRFFLADDMRHVEALSIEKVRSAGWERPPTYFVRTRIE
jgi:hypothetical protein